MQIKIITFNIWDLPLKISLKRQERIARLGGYLKEWQPDVICLQESFDVNNRRRLRQDLGYKNYYVPTDCDEARLAFFVKRLDLTGGLVVLSRFPIIESDFTSFPRPFRMAPAERLARKGFLKVMVETPAGLVLIVNTHLYTSGLTSNPDLRLSQIRYLLSELEGFDDVPVILSGDFNEDVAYGGKEFFRRIAAAGFVDGARVLKTGYEPTQRAENIYPPAWAFPINISRRIDYVFVRGSAAGLNFLDYRVLPHPQELTLSDHDPVLATVALV